MADVGTTKKKIDMGLHYVENDRVMSKVSITKYTKIPFLVGWLLLSEPGALIQILLSVRLALVPPPDLKPWICPRVHTINTKRKNVWRRSSSTSGTSNGLQQIYEGKVNVY